MPDDKYKLINRAQKEMHGNTIKNDGGNFQELRNMWSSKAHSQDKPSKVTNETIKKLPVLRIEPSTSPKNEKSTIFESIDKLPRIEERPSSPILSLLQNHIQSVASLQHSAKKIQTDVLTKKLKTAALHRWNIARHVFRSGLIFNRTRRASDSILPLLKKPEHPIRAESIESQAPFENLIDYVSSNKVNNLTIASNIKRSTSDAIESTRRHKLDDSIFQYEMILRHLTNHEQFVAESTLAVKPSDSSKPRSLNETELKFLSRTSVPNRQTQSLSRYMGRTFSEFIMNDLSPSPATKEERNRSISHTSAQTVVDEVDSPTELSTIVSNTTEAAATAVLNELDAVLEQSTTHNTEVNPPTIQTLSEEQLLMKSLFEGKKTSFSPEDLNMHSVRIPAELMETYQIAQKRCFFESEELVYATKMIKISRRGYTQHIRLLCLTSERLYNITKKDPYPKEGLLFQDICGITVSPYKDGFICIHTKETYEDRGDWLIVVDHPCEFVTKYFMTVKRKNNDSRFLRFKTKFTHCRRCYGEGSSDCTVEVHLSDCFRVKKAEYDLLNIFTT